MASIAIRNPDDGVKTRLRVARCRTTSTSPTCSGRSPTCCAAPYRPRQYERIMLPMTVLRHIDHRVAQSRAGRNPDTDGNHSIPQSEG